MWFPDSILKGFFGRGMNFTSEQPGREGGVIHRPFSLHYTIMHH